MDPSRRPVDSFFAQTRKPQSFGLEFEGAPIWLLGLDRHWCKEVYIVGFESYDGLLLHLKAKGIPTRLFRSAIEALGLQRITWLASRAVPAGVTLLVSGSFAFLTDVKAKRWLGWQCLLLQDAHCRQRTIPKWLVDGPFRWIRNRHASLGGSTSFVGLVGYRKSDTDFLKLNLVSLRRSLTHVINHGEEPSWRKPPETAKIYVGRDLLPSLPETCWVQYRSSRVKHGDLVRRLTSEESAIAFGVPHTWYDGGITVEEIPRVPIQTLHALLQASHHSCRPVVGAPLWAAQPLEDPPSATWLPGIKRFLPHSWVDSTAVTDKAVKNDAADVNTHMWEQRVTLPLPWTAGGFEILKRRMERFQRARLYQEFTAYMKSKYGASWLSSLQAARRLRRKGPDGTDGGGISEEDQDHVRDLLADGDTGPEVLHRISSSTWWDWKVGSSLIYWRWQQARQARDGMDVYVTGELPNNQKRARPPSKESFDLIKKKLDTILAREYVKLKPSRYDDMDAAFVESYMDYFAVPKGDDDIRMVYNGSSCGLNEVLWAPRFWLPTPKSATRVLNYNYCGVDIDLGEMFLNFPLPPELRPYSGIDLSAFKEALGFGHLDNDAFLIRWNRCWMGLRPSPYYAVRYYYWAEEFARGNPADEHNFLGWTRVILNLPGDTKFDPTLPFVMKWNDSIKNIAGDVVAFVDDLRASGMNEELSWSVARQFAARLQYLGIQDAPRKRRPPARVTGAWAGAIFSTINGIISQSVSQAKWDKGKELIRSLLAVLVSSSDGKMNYKELERARGFLGHLSMTYEILTPFLKGFHLTLASHLPYRDDDGWKMSEKAWDAYVQQLQENEKITDKEAGELRAPAHYDDIPTPELIKAVPLLQANLEALKELTSSAEPPKVTIRTMRVYQVMFGFGDASGSGFGSTLLSQEGLRVRIGIWEKAADGASSNWREFENVVESLEAEGENLRGAVVFFFTDNSTVESALYKGNSSSIKLYELVVRLRRLEMKMNCKFFVSHVSGKRMIVQGTDGVSRGQFHEGVTAGADMMTFIPLHLDPIQRSPRVEAWVRSWLGDSMEVLTPEHWYTRGHDHSGGTTCSRGFWRPTIKPGKFVWSLPPAAAGPALEELRKARIKRQESWHVVLVPRLFTPEWQKQLHKAADLVFSVPAGAEFWGADMLEPLTVAVVFPFLSCSPWQPQGTPKLQFLGRKLHSLLPAENVAARDILRKFLLAYERARTLPEDVQDPGMENELDPKDLSRLQKIWGAKLRPKGDYGRARDGDHVLIPFECDLCVFRKLRSESQPDPKSEQDKLLMGCIRRMILDAFWSRATSTVNGHRDRAAFGLRLSGLVKLRGPYIHKGPLPDYDHCGYEVAIQMLLHSRRKGRTDSSYVQFDSIRKMRAVFSNQVRASPQATAVTMSLGDQVGHYQRFSIDPCASFWFARFFQGCRFRMGQDWRPNQAMSTTLLIKMMDTVELRISDASSPRDLNRWIAFHAYATVTYVVSLRGPEGLLLDLAGLHRNWGTESDDSYFYLALLGKIKGEQHDRCHLIPCSNETQSGLRVKESVERLIAYKQAKGIKDGPAITDERGRPLTCRDIDDMMHEALEEIFESEKTLFPPAIRDVETLRSSYQAFRTLRRSSDTRALEMKVARDDIDIVNRWEQVEKAQGRKVGGQAMRHYYADSTLLKGPFKRYTSAM